MPRRKSLIAQMYEAHRKAKLQQQKLEDQASRAWAEEERKAAAQAAKEAAQQQREEERAAQARVRKEQQAERAAAQQERERERQAAAEARQQQRHAAEERREQQRQEAERRRLTAEQRAAEAEFRTEAVHAKIAAFDRLLLDRNRNLPNAANGLRTPSTRTARQRSWRRSSEAWPPRYTRTAWTDLAPPNTCRSPLSSGWNTNCPARTSCPR